MLMSVILETSDLTVEWVLIIVGEALVHHVLSVSLASSADDDVVFTNVAGFIVMWVIDDSHFVLLLHHITAQ